MRNHHLDPSRMPSLANLPLELRLHVAHHLDDESLLALAATSKAFNSLSISSYFNRHKAQNHSTKQLCLSPWNTTAHTFRAVSSSLRAHCFTSIVIELDPLAPFSRLYLDMQYIRSIVEHTRSLQRFDLRRADHEHWPKIPTTGIPPAFQPEDLLAMYSRLYEAVGRSGCKEVTMFGLPRLLSHLQSRHRPLKPLSLPVWNNSRIEGVNLLNSLFFSRLRDGQGRIISQGLLDDCFPNWRMHFLPTKVLPRWTPTYTSLLTGRDPPVRRRRSLNQFPCPRTQTNDLTRFKT